MGFLSKTGLELLWSHIVQLVHKETEGSATKEYVDNAIANIEPPSTEGLATKEYVDNAVANLVDSSPDTLNTLNELAAALGDDPNFATTVANQIGGKVDKTTTINGKALNNNIALNASDVGALPNTTAIPSNLVNGSTKSSLRTVGVPVENAIGMYAFAGGLRTTASGYSSHAEGNNSIASGDYSHAEGHQTIANSFCSHAEGQGTTASGKASHAEGYYTTASGDHSHAEGRNTIASGSYSHAEGSFSKAKGEISFAIGYGTNVNGSNGVAIGKYNLDPDSDENTLDTQLNTQQSFYKTNSYKTTYIEPTISLETGEVIAESTNVLTPENFLPDMYVINNNSDEPGYYKILSTPELDGNYYYANVDSYIIKLSYEQLSTYAFSVGNGTYDNRRSNAHTLDWSGNGWFQGNVYVGGTSQNDAAAKPLIAAPTASVGQTIIVKAVDENGKPTEWEAANLVTEARVNELIAAALAAIPNAEEADF